jgi:hypothetical protein
MLSLKSFLLFDSHRMGQLVQSSAGDGASHVASRVGIGDDAQAVMACNQYVAHHSSL